MIYISPVLTIVVIVIIGIISLVTPFPLISIYIFPLLLGVHVLVIVEKHRTIGGCKTQTRKPSTDRHSDRQADRENKKVF